MDSTSTCPEWAAEIKKFLHSSAIQRIALPVPRHTATGFIPVQAVTETAGMGLKLDAQLRKENLQIGDVIGKFRSIESWSVSNSRARREGMQFHVACGVTPALQTT